MGRGDKQGKASKQTSGAWANHEVSMAVRFSISGTDEVFPRLPEVPRIAVVRSTKLPEHCTRRLHASWPRRLARPPVAAERRGILVVVRERHTGEPVLSAASHNESARVVDHPRGVGQRHADVRPPIPVHTVRVGIHHLHVREERLASRLLGVHAVVAPQVDLCWHKSWKATILRRCNCCVCVPCEGLVTGRER